MLSAVCPETGALAVLIFCHPCGRRIVPRICGGARHSIYSSTDMWVHRYCVVSNARSGGCRRPQRADAACLPPSVRGEVAMQVRLFRYLEPLGNQEEWDAVCRKEGRDYYCSL